MEFPIMFPRTLILLTFASYLGIASAHGQKDIGPGPVPVQADLFEVSVGFNYIYLDNQFPETKNLYGVSTAAFINATSWLAVGGEFMADFGSHSVPIFFRRTIDVDSRRYVYIFGPRVTVWHNPRFRVFAEALAGGVHAEAKFSSAQFPFISRTASSDALAAAFGAGFDWRFTNHLSWRIVQADYLGTNLGNQWQNNFRASTSLCYSFGHR
jgi:hypothetical protein